ncbi:MAG: hypothetical protein KDE09_26455, partial [Anaerolineales bacterium]|nr:hypothetical protein [Anaerolineales bacterium]
MIYESERRGAEESQAGELRPLSQAQFLMWLGQQLNPTAPLYNMIQTFRIAGQVNRPVFAAAWQALVDRSDALRTTIHLVD